MKASPKVLLIFVYFIITFIGTATLQYNPQFFQKIQELMVLKDELGAFGVFFYILVSATVMALAIPLQFIDLVLGILYPVKVAILILVSSKVLGAGMSFYIANNFLSQESKD